MATPRTGRPRGRPKGAKNKPKLPVVVPDNMQREQAEREQRAEQAAARLAADPIKLAPLEVMLANMDWAWNKAATLLQEIVKDPAASPEVKLEAYKEMMRLRNTVQHFAKDAAPYVHPPLRAKDAPPDEPVDKVVDVDPLREHLTEFAKFFNLPKPEVA